MDRLPKDIEYLIYDYIKPTEEYAQMLLQIRLYQMYYPFQKVIKEAVQRIEEWACCECNTIFEPTSPVRMVAGRDGDEKCVYACLDNPDCEAH